MLSRQIFVGPLGGLTNQT